MAFHHLALATRDIDATHTFYSRVLGFELMKAVVGATPAGGWAKHLFYDTGGGELLAFWDLHDPEIRQDFDPAISTGLGLPEWVVHVAFAARDVADLDGRRQRLLDGGYDVAEIDHGWCRSIYTLDPNGILVEYCTTTRLFSAEDQAAALQALRDPNPRLEAPAPPPKIHRTSAQPLHQRERISEA
jgi:catechol 2,3-dioxygenase-like lactoylglutathione lyase family enzyme